MTRTCLGFVALVVGCLAAGCVVVQDDAGPGSASGEGGSDGEGGSGGGSAGAGSGSSCPVAAGDRARVEAIVTASVATASWITSNSHGHGVFAGRGFGTAVPLTTTGVIYSATLAEACTEPKTFDPTCDEPEEGAGEPIRCSQLACEAAGKLSAKVWLDGLPATVPADPPPGGVTVHKMEHTTRYEEVGTDGLELRWDGEVEISLADGFSATWTPEGAASIAGGEVSSGSLSDEITGVAPAAIVFDLTFGEEVPAGELLYGTDAIAAVTDVGVTWVGACAP